MIVSTSLTSSLTNSLSSSVSFSGPRSSRMRRRAIAPARVAAAFIALCISTVFAAAAATPHAGSPPAYDAWRNAQGERANETPGMKSNKGFAAVIHLATKTEAERFLREWNETPTAHAPMLKPAEGIARGESLVLVILYAGCSAQAEGPAPCSATLDVNIFDPNGKLLMEQFDIALARDLPAYPRIVQLSPVTLQTDFDATDPLGLYRYDVVLRNPERNATLALTETIVLSDTPARVEPRTTIETPASARTPASP